MAVRVVVFDIGETLVDETNMWTRVAAAGGVTPFTLMAGLGATIALDRDHNDVWDLLGIDQPPGTWTMDDWYPDALPCIERLRAAGYRVCGSGNTPSFVEHDLREHLDAVGSSESWGVHKPDPAFFARVVELAGVEPGKIAYVGDRVDNDVGPALRAGMVGVHIRRGPWGYLQGPAAGRDPDRLPRRAAGGPGVTIRVGIGVDAHALERGVPLVLGGVRFEYDRGLAGHSDGDVLAHALVDAVLGAAGLGDIGSLFPSDDERYRGASSLDLLREAYRQVESSGWTLVNADCILIGEQPRIAPHREEMRRCLSEALGGGEVNVRATTTDHLGFTGRGEGLAAQAVALLERA